jgi:hypothetical protein
MAGSARRGFGMARDDAAAKPSEEFVGHPLGRHVEGRGR